MATTSLIITRAGLGLPDLQLMDKANGFKAYGALILGGFAMDINMAPSVPWIDNEQAVSARKTNTNYTVRVCAYGNTPTILEERLDILEAAFSQLSFNLAQTINGKTLTYNCVCATSGTTDIDLPDVYHRRGKMPMVFTGGLRRRL